MQYDYLKGKLKRMRRTLYRIFKCYAQLLSIEFFLSFFYNLFIAQFIINVQDS